MVNAIQSDDIASFETAVTQSPEVLTYAFGRFPVLSLCYLYKSTAIIKKYEEKLVKVTYHNQVEEPQQAYAKFKNLAGVHLQKYTTGYVHPAEMLALLKETAYLKKKFGVLKPNESAQSNILNVYARRGRSAKIDLGNLIVADEPFSFKMRLLGIAAASVITLFIILFSVSMGVVFSSIGFGTESSPFAIYSAEQLRLAAGTNSHYILRNDIDLPDDFIIDNFVARLDGNGHTLYVGGAAPVITTLRGRVRNIHIQVRNEAIEVEGRVSFFVYTIIGGSIENATLNANATLTKSAHGAVVFGGLVLENTNGSIEHVRISGNIEIVSHYASNVAVGGIVGVNAFMGRGITRNNARVLHSQNDMHITLRAPGASAATHLVLGGIAAANSGVLQGNLNTATLTLSTTNGLADVGGIVGFALTDQLAYYGYILENGSFGHLNLTATGGAHIFSGGIVGWAHHATINRNFSLATVSVAGSPTHIHTGGIVGALVTSIQQGYWQYPYANVANNYYVIQSPYITHGVSAMYAHNMQGLPMFPDAILDTWLNLSSATESQIRDLPFFRQPLQGGNA